MDAVSFHRISSSFILKKKFLLAVEGYAVLSDRSATLKSFLLPMKVPHINSQNGKQFVL